MKRKISLIVLVLIITITIFYLFSNKNDNKLEVNDSIESDIKVAKLTLVGDFLFEQPFYDAIENGYDKNEYFSLIKPYFEKDDLSLGNMEVVIGNNKLKTSGVGYNFCAPMYVGDLVNDLSLDVLSTANNHSFDRGVDGINSTIDFLVIKEK